MGATDPQTGQPLTDAEICDRDDRVAERCHCRVGEQVDDLLQLVWAPVRASRVVGVPVQRVANLPL
jgi:hypothetical protein